MQIIVMDSQVGQCSVEAAADHHLGLGRECQLGPDDVIEPAVLIDTQLAFAVAQAAAGEHPRQMMPALRFRLVFPFSGHSVGEPEGFIRCAPRQFGGRGAGSSPLDQCLLAAGWGIPPDPGVHRPRAVAVERIPGGLVPHQMIIAAKTHRGNAA
jgi:hypothetical protein